MTERLITHQVESDKRLSYIYEDAKRSIGGKRFRELQEIGERSFEAVKNKRIMHIDAYKYAKRRIKDIPIYDSDLTSSTRLEANPRIGKNGLYPEREI